jgi:hypothetical protein
MLSEQLARLHRFCVQHLLYPLLLSSALACAIFTDVSFGVRVARTVSSCGIYFSRGFRTDAVC